MIYLVKMIFQNYVYNLNQQAASYGTNSSIVSSTRHMGYSDQTLQCSNLANCPGDEVASGYNNGTTYNIAS